MPYNYGTIVHTSNAGVGDPAPSMGQHSSSSPSMQRQHHDAKNNQSQIQRMRGYAQHLMAKKLLATSGNHTTLARLNETPNKSQFNEHISPINSVTNLSNYKNFALANQQQN